MIADSNGIIGIALGGAIFQYAEGLGWAQVGGLGDAVSLVTSKDLSARSELFAQLTDGSIWVYHWDTGTWASTGGSLVAGTMIANSYGISGVASGGAVSQYYDESGWVHIGPLTGVTSLLSGQGELFAETADGSIWDFSYATGQWTDFGGDFTPGTLIANRIGVTGIVGGTVYHYTDASGWVAIPSVQSFVSVTDAVNSHGGDDLFARTSDGTLYEFSFGAPNGWTDEYGRFL